MENEFDEDKAIAFIKNKIYKEEKSQPQDDDLLLIIDTIWDYYDQNGFLSLDIDDEEKDLNMEDLIKFVKKEIKKSGIDSIEPELVEEIVKAELEYEETLEDNF